MEGTRLLSLLFVFMAGHAVDCAEDPTYLIYFPKYLRPGFEIQIVAEILKNPNPVNFTAMLTSPAKEVNYKLEATLTEGESKLLAFNDVIPIGYDGTREFTMDVTGIDSVTGEAVLSNSTSDLVYKPKALSIFIQTDKGIYKPTQTIKFRAVVTTPDLLPHNGNVTYKLTDPDSNIVFRKKDAQLVKGITGSEFTLGRYSTQGEWKIIFEADGSEESVTVTVEQYTLPKFEVKITTDQSFLDPTSAKLSGTVSAEFTFGQRVKGSGFLTFQRVYRSRWYYYMNEEMKSYKVDISNFDGEYTFSIPLQTIKEKLGIHGFYDQVQITANITDKNSLVELQNSATVDLKTTPFKVEVVNAPKIAKPGFLYTAFMKVTRQDGALLSDAEIDSFGLYMKMQYVEGYPTYTYKDEDPKSIAIQQNGLAMLQFTVKSDNFSEIAFEVKSTKYSSEYFGNWHANRFQSPSGVYVQVSSAETELTPSENTVMDVRTNAVDKTYSITMLARGNIVLQDTHTPSSYEKEGNINKFQYQFLVEKNMAPSVIVVVSTMGEEGEVIADSISFRVSYSLPNQVSIHPSVERTETGKPVSITVRTTPESLIALRAIDRSVILQKEGNDITSDNILQDIDSYATSELQRPWWFYYSWNMDGTNAKDIFKKSGIIVFTDGATFISQTVGPNIIYDDEIFEDGPVFAELEIMFNKEVNAAETGTAVQKGIEPPKIRKDFPETWIWEESVAGNSGEKVFSYVLPDTATTWEISAFAVSDTKGLGVAEPNAKIVASRDFFISANLPATMVKGEVLSMRTTVYNSFPTDLQTSLTLEDSEWYELVITANDTNSTGSVRNFKIPSRDGYTTVFPIRFLKPGVAKIKLTALSELANDAVERTLPVKPEGVENDISRSYLIERSDANENDTVVTFPIKIPDDAISGSIYGRISVSGNIMGNTLNNLGNLLRLPTGCGEQTMLSFAPDVYVSLYLKNVNLLSGKIEEKSRKHIQAGYQNELRYQHSDGSFSAFQHDEHGSTWLTAFVIKCFIAARELSSDLVETPKINHGIEFLLSKQNKDGVFKESGTVRHRDMQGGVNSDETMTSYIVVSLMEGDYGSEYEKIPEAVKKSQTFLESRVDTTKDTFTLAIMAYALALSDSEAAGTIMNELETRAETIGNLKFWKKNAEKEQKCSRDWFGFMGHCISEATSSDIEVTSYILLTMIKLQRTDDIMSVVRWLVTQRGKLGGYRSTQDTVMAIQALSTFAGIYSDRTIDISLSTSHSADSSFGAEFKVNNDNGVILQTTEFPGENGEVSVSAKGVGFADVQVAYQYNTPIPDPKDEPFKLTVDVKKVRELERMELKACSSINKERENPVEKTGMFIIVVKLPSGYTVDDQEAAENNKKAKLVELDGDELTGYFDELTADDELCMTLYLNRFAMVSEVRPQMLQVIDYYQPDVRTMRNYTTPAYYAKVCDSCGAECPGCPGGSASKMYISLWASMILMIIATIFLQQ